MLALRPADPADIPAVCEFLHTHMDARLSRDRWRRIMDYPWRVDPPNRGCLLEDAAGHTVGFLGLVYAERLIDGRPEVLVNLTSWYILRPYRGLDTALAMLDAATADPRATYTVFSSHRTVTRLMRRAGFRMLDDRRSVWRPDATSQGGVGVLTEPSAIRAALSHSDRQLLDDHSPYNVTPFLLQADGAPCLVLMSIRRKGADIAYHEALHISAPGLFARHAQAFANAILPADNALMAVDCRFLSDQTNTVPTEAIPAPRFYKSSRLAPQQVDFLYSEIQLLDLKLF